MAMRTSFLPRALIGAASLAISCCAGAGRAPVAPSSSAAARDPVQEVDPFIGTDDSNAPNPVPGGAGGSTFPGATAPFGMIQWGPDTPTASPSGYRYKDKTVEGFSLTHFNGAGCPNNEDLPILPLIGPMAGSPAMKKYQAPFSHSTESASPGLYAVTLDESRIKVELTATTRTGFGRFTFPPSQEATLLFDASHHATHAKPGVIEVVGNDRLRGHVTGGNFCGTSGVFKIYFTVQF